MENLILVHHPCLGCSSIVEKAHGSPRNIDLPRRHAAERGSAGALSQNERDGHDGLVRNPSLFEASVACSKAAELCVGHCVETLAQGDKSLIACGRNSREVLVVCNALRALAAQNSPHLAKFAMLSAEVCRSCEAECIANIHTACV